MALAATDVLTVELVARRRPVITVRQAELWDAFWAAYAATRTRPAVARFLHAIVGDAVICPACGGILRPHCASTTCPWQKCPRQTCQRWGYPARPGMWRHPYDNNPKPAGGA